MATNGNFTYQDQYKGSADQYVTSSVTTEASSAANSGNNLSKDEVGWYFVEQYYTTLSKSPEKLHLFYSKRSQFVYGLEAEVANVSVGRAAIQERIKELDFQDCKVRIANVDSQASFDNIVIQVIGETSNKAAEPKKFVQTFVLAQQPSGYFVLNDILRYINEEEEETAEAETEPKAEAAEAQAVPEPQIAAEQEVHQPVSTVSANEDSSAPLDASIVDRRLEEVSAVEKETLPSSTLDTPADSVPEVPDATAAKSDAPAPVESAPDPDTAAQELAEEDSKQTEIPKDPSPTVVAPRSLAPTPAEPEKPKEPPKPMTWASRAAAAAGPPRPVVPLPKTATPPAATQARAAAPVPTAAAPSASPAAAAQTLEASAPNTKPAAKENANEWQTAGAESKRQSRPLSISGPPPEKEGTLAYIRNVTEKIQADDLRAALSKYGELAYLDINRAKNCAFVEFATPSAYQAATAANPHVVNDEEINVEPRRPKANAYGGSNYSANRGGLPSSRGRGGYGGDRGGREVSGSGSQRAGYGGLNRPARGGPATRGGGRGAAQAGTA